ncbi:MAG TPA: zf-HC2 domain-containing protein [Candidatus Eisenbacteria bacterium]|jgi:hypothetical protein
MSDVWTDRLSDYLDGELGERQRRELERHLDECAECVATLAELRSVVGKAQALTHEPPEFDLWPGIAARIGPGAKRSIGPARRREGWWGGGRFSLTVPQAVAASVVLVLLSGGSVWLALGGRQRAAFPTGVGSGPVAVAPVGDDSARGPASPAGSRAQRTSEPGAVATAFVAGADPRYEATITELNRILQGGRNRLDPATVKVLERNLAIIDQAVAEARRAVEADPSNFYLREHLAQTMRRKASLLRLATSIVGAQG